MKDLLNKQEKRDLKRHGLPTEVQIKDVSGKEVWGILVVSAGNKEVHDSSYPFIKIFGVVRDSDKLLFLGWHDHWIAHVPTNTDSLGKNIFFVKPWMRLRWKVTDSFMSLSTFEIGNYYLDENSLDEKSEKFVILH